MKKKTASEHLRWLADRLVNVYGESPNTDFVLATRAHADALDLADLTDTWSSVAFALPAVNNAVLVFESGRVRRGVLRAEGGHSWDVDGDSAVGAITHWQPLPAPPVVLVATVHRMGVKASSTDTTSSHITTHSSQTGSFPLPSWSLVVRTVGFGSASRRRTSGSVSGIYLNSAVQHPLRSAKTGSSTMRQLSPRVRVVGMTQAIGRR